MDFLGWYAPPCRNDDIDYDKSNPTSNPNSNPTSPPRPTTQAQNTHKQTIMLPCSIADIWKDPPTPPHSNGYANSATDYANSATKPETTNAHNHVASDTNVATPSFIIVQFAKSTILDIRTASSANHRNQNKPCYATTINHPILKFVSTQDAPALAQIILNTPGRYIHAQTNGDDIDQYHVQSRLTHSLSSYYTHSITDNTQPITQPQSGIPQAAQELYNAMQTKQTTNNITHKQIHIIGIIQFNCQQNNN